MSHKSIKKIVCATKEETTVIHGEFATSENTDNIFAMHTLRIFDKIVNNRV